MQRKNTPGFPANSCNVKMPDMTTMLESVCEESDVDQQKRRQQLINYAHLQWGFKNWSWSVTKQDVDFIDFVAGKHQVGVAAFVTVNVKTLDIHRQDLGYATIQAFNKGSAIFRARKCAVTNALRETLLSFGGTFAAGLMDLLESQKIDLIKTQPNDATQENNPNVANKDTAAPKNAPNTRVTRKESSDSNASKEVAPIPTRSPHKNSIPQVTPTVVKPCVVPVAKAQPMPANHIPPPLGKHHFPPANQLPPKPAAPPASAHLRPNSNVSFVMMPGMMYPPPPAAPARMPLPPHQHVFPNYYEYAPTPWHFYDGFDRHHGNVNLNFNIPPKNLVVNSRSGTVECKNSCSPGKVGLAGEEHAVLAPPHAVPHPPQHPAFHHNGNGACWIKPTIFYDGFWTEQKVKKWVAEQVEKQFPENAAHPPPSLSVPAAPTHPSPHTELPKE